jgi:hypothetical protein
MINPNKLSIVDESNKPNKLPISVEDYTDFTKNKTFVNRWVRRYSKRIWWLKTIKYDFPDLEVLIQSVFPDKIVKIKISSNDATVELFPKNYIDQNSLIDSLILRGDIGKMYLIRDILDLSREANFEKLAAYIKKTYPQVEINND